MTPRCKAMHRAATIASMLIVSASVLALAPKAEAKHGCGSRGYQSGRSYNRGSGYYSGRSYNRGYSNYRGYNDNRGYNNYRSYSYPRGYSYSYPRRRSSFSLSFSIGNALPRGYAYYDPYCDQRFSTINVYRNHCRVSHHPQAVDVIYVGGGGYGPSCNSGGCGDDCDN